MTTKKTGTTNWDNTSTNNNGNNNGNKGRGKKYEEDTWVNDGLGADWDFSVMEAGTVKDVK